MDADSLSKILNNKKVTLRIRDLAITISCSYAINIQFQTINVGGIMEFRIIMKASLLEAQYSLANILCTYYVEHSDLNAFRIRLYK